MEGEPAGKGNVGLGEGTTRLARLRAARAAAAAAAAAGGKPAGAFAPTTTRKERLRLRRGTGREISSRPFVIRVNIPGIMKQKSSSDMDVSGGSEANDWRAATSVMSIVEIGEDSHASAGSGSGSGASNVNPFKVNVGSEDGPRPMFRPSTAHLRAGEQTPGGAKPSRDSTAGTPNAAEALAMMMHSEYPEGLPEEIAGVSHFATTQRDEPPLADFPGEADMEIGYDDVMPYDDDGFVEPAAPRKRTTSGVPHKRLRAEMERRKSLALAGTQTVQGGVRRSTRQRSKPLEYWRGETKVYQRVHSSLPTVAQIERRTANPIWPRKTPGGPSQPFRVSRLRPAEILRDFGVDLPDPSPLDRRGVRYGLMSPAEQPVAANWAEKYGIHPLVKPAPPGRGVPLLREEDVVPSDVDEVSRPKKRGRKPKAVKEAEERAANEAYIASAVAEIMNNVVAANTSPEDVQVDVEAAATVEATEIDVVEAEVVAIAESEEKDEDDLDEDEAEREAERLADEAVAEVERELAAELAEEEAEAAKITMEQDMTAVTEDEEKEEPVLGDVEEEADARQSAKADAEEPTTSAVPAFTEEAECVIDDEEANIEPTTVVTAEVEEDASVLRELDENVDEAIDMEIDAPPSVAKPTVQEPIEGVEADVDAN
ncbi:hypothetical protein BE221DRAFT_148078 [Ostreococcus tauri]|uniref:Uncharacterized protein n=1 Tax=Ostreococcus tauri TaxID=70448 RepID=A0A1Y5I877_OSTTA|nr:hypothetical protein BE221DRAFT_148078 [Ostreococcus tauri]